MRMYILYFLLIFSVFLSSQEEITIFKLKELSLKKEVYPWGEELKLVSEATAHTILENKPLRFKILYNHGKAFEINMALNKVLDKDFVEGRLSIDSLNTATQKILPGIYIVEVDFDLESQNQDFKNEWNKRFGTKTPKIHKKPFLIGNEIEAKKCKEHYKSFFIEKIKELNNLYRELYDNKKEALGKTAKNRFVRRKRFLENVWYSWFKNDFLEKLINIEEDFKKQEQIIFSNAYPETLASMKEYIAVLIKMGRLATVDIYMAYNTKQNVENLNSIDMTGLRTEGDFIYYIQKLHRTSSDELEVSFKKELGYLPPPYSY